MPLRGVKADPHGSRTDDCAVFYVTFGNKFLSKRQNKCREGYGTALLAETAKDS